MKHLIKSIGIGLSILAVPTLLAYGLAVNENLTLGIIATWVVLVVAYYIGNIFTH